jgi:hypothetical protein
MDADTDALTGFRAHASESMTEYAKFGGRVTRIAAASALFEGEHA